MRASVTRWAIRPLAAACLAAAASLTVAPTAWAHNVTGAYRSAVLSVRPAVPGLKIEVVNGGNDLKVTDRSSVTIVIDGYEGEPYLRFTPDGVYRNTRSPATYLNQTTDASAALPPDADASAPPVWRKVSSDRTYEWHDHRIHWMASQPPAPVRDKPAKRSHIFDWKVAGTAGGAPFTVRGTLDWVPQDTRITPLLLLLVGANIAFVLALAWYVGMLGHRRTTVDGSPSLTRPG
jgi:hypothetical protein